MRLGSCPCQLQPNSLSIRLINKRLFSERHRHRYELNNKYRDTLVEAGMLIAGVSPDNSLVEILSCQIILGLLVANSILNLSRDQTMLIHSLKTLFKQL